MKESPSCFVAAGRQALRLRPERTARLALATLALLVAAGCSSGGGGDDDELFTSPDTGANSPPAPGAAVVAMLELEAPTRTPFVLRGTVPVPPGTYPRPDGLVPLALVNSDGTVVPTQLEIVSRYPVDSDGAEVVEVLGRVDLPAGTKPGQRVSYRVIDQLHGDGPLPVSSTIKKFLLTPGNAVLVAEDVFGNRYEADVFANLRGYNNTKASQLLRKGAAAVQFRVHNVMKPVGNKIGSPNGALPHLFGVHAYVTAWSNTDAVSVDLRVHNSSDGFNKSHPYDNPLGDVYFKKIELRLPQGWVAMLDVDDACKGGNYKSGAYVYVPLVKPNSDGSMHLMPKQAQFHRRMGVAQTGDAALALHLAYDEGLGFCRKGVSPNGADLYSWWNPQTARYFTQSHLLPDLSWFPAQNMESALAGDYWMVRTALETGNPGNWIVPAPALGWAHPWGVNYGGMTGGAEINLYDGLELAHVGTNKGWKGAQLVHRMYADRQPTALYDEFGESTYIEKWVIQGASFPFIEMNFWGKLLKGPDPFGFNQAPQYQVQYVQSNGLQPAYENQLRGYMPIDFQHYVRFTRTPKVLAWLGNDAIAKDDLRFAAEIARMSMHDYPNSSGKNASGSYLYGAEAFVKAKPGHGFSWGRGESWSVDAVVAAYSLGDKAYRKRVRPWLNLCADVVAQGQIPCSGFVQGTVNKWLQGKWRIRASPEQAINEHVLWGLKETVFRGKDIARTKQTEHFLAESIQSMIGPLAWAPQYNAPYFLVATAELDLNIPPFCSSIPAGGQANGPDGFQTWSSFAYGYELTGDPEFLNKATAMSGGGNLLQNMQKEGLKNMVNKAALMAILQ